MQAIGSASGGAGGHLSALPDDRDVGRELQRSQHRRSQGPENRDGRAAFALMHDALDSVWKETHRILKPGGFCLYQHRRCRPAPSATPSCSTPIMRAF